MNSFIKRHFKKPAHLFRCNRVFYFSEVNDFSCSHDDCVVAVTRGKGQVMEYYDDCLLYTSDAADEL